MFYYFDYPAGKAGPIHCAAIIDRDDDYPDDWQIVAMTADGKWLHECSPLAEILTAYAYERRRYDIDMEWMLREIP